MVAKINKFKVNTQMITITQANEVLTGVGSTQWIEFRNTDIAIQIAGSATAVSALIERSSIFPGETGSDAVVAPADTTAITGNPSTGIAVASYTEPGGGWWRVRVTSMTGASVSIGLSGRGAD